MEILYTVDGVEKFRYGPNKDGNTEGGEAAEIDSCPWIYGAASNRVFLFCTIIEIKRKHICIIVRIV